MIVVSSLVVVGMGSAGLFVLRNMKDHYDKVCCVGLPNSIGMFSKFGEKHFVRKKSDLEIILTKIAETTDRKPKAVIASEYFLRLILEQVPRFFEMFEVMGPSADICNILSSKINAYQYFSNFGIGTLKAYQLAKYDEIDNDLFPLLVKWDRYPLCQDKQLQQFPKTMVLKNEAQLLDIKEKFTHCLGGLIAQQMLNSSEQISYGAFYNEGEELAGIFVKQARQYPRGMTSFAFEIPADRRNSKLLAKIYESLGELNYSGFIEMEFRVDGQSFLLIDVNPRVWSWASIMGKRYSDFFESITQGRKAKKTGIEKVFWRSTLRDMVFLVKNPKAIFDWHAPKSIAREIFDIHDLGPQIAYIKKNLGNRLWRRNDTKNN